MTHLLQARGWYGVFLQASDLPPIETEGNELRPQLSLHVRLRPLIGWMSAEGGFRGLYYNEARGSLSTSFKISDDHRGHHLGDICEEESGTIRALLIASVIENGALQHQRYLQTYAVQLSKEADLLLIQKKIPRPRPPKIEEEN